MGIGELLAKAASFIKSHLVAAFCVCGAVFIILILLVILAVVRRVPEKQAVPDSLPLSRSPGDFFMPPEPDYVPPILLEREPKDGWAEEDARPFWTDPMEGNARVWEDRMKKSIDELLENVP
ncbi:MAG: hypothetical protein LBI67_06180 [Treponema sp.]|jgi:hypothetical protein|nr:hypothetical protein [Treponema sp.]